MTKNRFGNLTYQVFHISLSTNLFDSNEVCLNVTTYSLDAENIMMQQRIKEPDPISHLVNPRTAGLILSVQGPTYSRQCLSFESTHSVHFHLIPHNVYIWCHVQAFGTQMSLSITNDAQLMWSSPPRILSNTREFFRYSLSVQWKRITYIHDMLSVHSLKIRKEVGWFPLRPSDQLNWGEKRKLGIVSFLYTIPWLSKRTHAFSIRVVTECSQIRTSSTKRAFLMVHWKSLKRLPNWLSMVILRLFDMFSSSPSCQSPS